MLIIYFHVGYVTWLKLDKRVQDQNITSANSDNNGTLLRNGNSLNRTSTKKGSADSLPLVSFSQNNSWAHFNNSEKG